jgi:hypothetical protein
MSTTDKAWEDMLSSEKIHDDGQKYTSQDIVMAMLYAYARLQKERSSSASGVVSMSRREYEKYRRKEDPHWWDIHDHAGSWMNAKKVLPVPSSEMTRRNRRGNDATAEKFSQVLSSIAQEYDIKPHEVSIRQFMRFKKEHPEYNLANFKVYARYIADSEKWDDAKIIALSKVGRF